MFPVFGLQGSPWYFWRAATRRPECLPLWKAEVSQAALHPLRLHLCLQLRLMFLQRALQQNRCLVQKMLVSLVFTPCNAAIP